jgi:hypothetical protein
MYSVEQVSASHLNMVARLLNGGSTMLAQTGMRLLQALGLRQLDLVWQVVPRKAGNPRPPAPLPPNATLDQQLAWAVDQRRFDLGWTQNDIALRVIGPRSGEAISDKHVAAFLKGQTQVFSGVGLEILQALGLDRFDVSWERLEKAVPRVELLPQVTPNEAAQSTHTPRPRISAEFNRHELQQLQAAAQSQGITVERLIRNAALAILKPGRHHSAAQLRSIRAEANAQGHEWSLEELSEEQLPLFWNETWTREQLRQGRSISQIALLAGGWPTRSAAHYLLNVYGIRLSRPRLSRASQQELREKISAGLSREEAGAELGVSRFVAAHYAQGLPDQRERNFEIKVAAVATWPATTAQIAASLFGGQGNRASSWCRDMVKSGRLQRLRRGLYAVSDVNRQTVGSSTAPNQV